MTVIRLALCIACLALVVSAHAYASPTVLLTPSANFVDVGEIFWVYLEVDDSGDSLACYKIEFTFDSAIVELIGGYEGELFSNSGYPTFFKWETDAPDTQRVLNCVLGVGTYVLGPGVIAELKFEALANGITCVDYLDVDMADVHRNDILDFDTENAWIYVGPVSADELNEDPSTGEIHLRDEVLVFPNPFLSETSIAFNSHRSGDDILLRIFDLRGREVSCLPSRAEVPGWNTAVWNGEDEHGRPVPSGIYFLRASRSDGSELTTKLLRVR